MVRKNPLIIMILCIMPSLVFINGSILLLFFIGVSIGLLLIVYRNKDESNDFFLIFIAIFLIIRLLSLSTRNLFVTPSDDLIVYFERYNHCSNIGFKCLTDFAFSAEPFLYIYFVILPTNLSPSVLLLCTGALLCLISFFIYAKLLRFYGFSLVLFAMIFDTILFGWIHGQVIRQSIAVHFVLLALVLLSNKVNKILLLLLASTAHFSAILSWLQVNLINNVNFTRKNLVRIILLIILSGVCIFLISYKFSNQIYSNTDPVTFTLAVMLSFLLCVFGYVTRVNILALGYFSVLIIISILVSPYKMLYERAFFIFYAFPATTFLIWCKIVRSSYINYYVYRSHRIFLMVLSIIMLIYWFYRSLFPANGPFSPWVNTVWP